MRRQFGKTLTKLAKQDKDITLLVGDIGYKIFDEFREQFPDRFYNLGCMEQSMVSIGAGMALEGKKPYIYTITPFLIERAFEQIKVDVDAMDLNIKLIGYADYPKQGTTHQELNAKGLMKLLKNTICYYPRTSYGTNFATKISYSHKSPTFISLKKAK